MTAGNLKTSIFSVFILLFHPSPTATVGMTFSIHFKKINVFMLAERCEKVTLYTKILKCLFKIFQWYENSPNEGSSVLRKRCRSTPSLLIAATL